MAVYNKGLHHYHIRKRVHLKHEPYPHPNKLKRIYDKIIYVVVILCPIMNLPQLLKVWLEKDASGVSAISWIGFSFISLTWLIYGILHRDKHILVMNAFLIVIQAFIAVGVILYG